MRCFALFGQIVNNSALTFGPRAVPLSVLDLAPVPDGGTAAEALRATIVAALSRATQPVVSPTAS